MDGFGVLLDQQDIIAPGIVLEVVASEVLERAARRDARQQLLTLVLERPEFRFAADSGGAGSDRVVTLAPLRVPPVVVALDQQLCDVARREIELAARDVLDALVVGGLEAADLGEARAR